MIGWKMAKDKCIREVKPCQYIWRHTYSYWNIFKQLKFLSKYFSGQLFAVFLFMVTLPLPANILPQTSADHNLSKDNEYRRSTKLIILTNDCG